MLEVWNAGVTTRDDPMSNPMSNTLLPYQPNLDPWVLRAIASPTVTSASSHNTSSYSKLS